MRRIFLLLSLIAGVGYFSVATATTYATNQCTPNGGWGNLTPLSVDAIEGNAWRQYMVTVPIGESVWVQQVQDLTVERLSSMSTFMSGQNSGFGFSWIHGYGVFEVHRDVSNPVDGSSTRVRAEVGKPEDSCLGLGVIDATEAWSGKFTFTAYGVSTNPEASRTIGLHGSSGVTFISQAGGPEAFAYSEADFYGGKNEMLRVGAPSGTVSSIENSSLTVNVTRGLRAHFRSASPSTKLSIQTPDGEIKGSGGYCDYYGLPIPLSCGGPSLGVSTSTTGTYRFTIERAENDPQIWLFGADVNPRAE